MLFQIIVLVFILLLTAYLATQGWFSATLVFVSAIFASMLAGALYEPFSGLINTYRPDFGHAVTYLLVFFLSFSALRITSDLLIRGNVKVQVWVDRAGGGIVGLLASLVIVGTTVIGIEMMPFPQAIMGSYGWDRYPDGNRLADDTHAPETKLWLNPDGFVTWIYEMSLGRSMGGSYGGDFTFAQAHPDLGEELWGYRHRVQLASNFAMPNSMMDAPVAWAYVERPPSATKPDEKNAWNSEKNRYVVRMKVRKGSDFPEASTDKDLFFRATASQVRLVALDSSGNAVQCYPVGFFSNGERFVPWGEPKYRQIPGKVGIEPVSVAYVQEDYSSADSAGEAVIIDWAFVLPGDSKPAFLEVKSLARQRVEVATSMPALAANQYPPRKHLQETFVCSVVMTDGATPIKQHKLYIVAASAKRAVFKSLVSEISQKLDEEKEVAKNKPDPGIPSFDQIRVAVDTSRNISLGNDDSDLSWNNQIVNTAVWASLSLVNGSSNHVTVNKYLDERITPLINDPRVDHTLLTTNDLGKTPDTQMFKGAHCILAWYLTPEHIYVWWPGFDAKAKETCTFILTTNAKAASPTAEVKEFAPDFVWPPTK